MSQTQETIEPEMATDETLHVIVMMMMMTDDAA